MALTRQAIALLIGAFFAWLIARTDIPMKGLLEFFFWLSFFLPALPETMGWILLLDPKYGLMNQGLISLGILSQPIFNIYSFWGIVWAHMGGTVSVKVMLLAPAFRNLDAVLEEASKISGASGVANVFSHRHTGDDAGDPGDDDPGSDPLVGSLRDRTPARHTDRPASLLDEDSRVGDLGAAAIRAGDGAQHGVPRRAVADGRAATQIYRQAQL